MHLSMPSCQSTGSDVIGGGKQSVVDGRSPGWAGHTRSSVTYRLPDLYSCTEVHIHPAQSSLFPLIWHLTNVERAPWKLKCGFFSTLVKSETWNFSTPTRETAGLEPRLASLSSSWVHIKYDQSASCSVAMASLTRDELYTPGNCLVSSTFYSLKLCFVIAVYCSSRKETNTLELKKSPGLAQR